MVVELGVRSREQKALLGVRGAKNFVLKIYSRQEQGGMDYMNTVILVELQCDSFVVLYLVAIHLNVGCSSNRQ